MSGTPTEAEIQTQWRNVIGILETLRNHVDGTHAGAGGLWDTLLQSLEGEYTPTELANWAASVRSGCSDLLSPAVATQALTPILFEYANRIHSDASATQGFGSGYRTAAQIFRALYDWFVDKSYTVESRNITYDTSASTGASNVGNGACGRLTEDENGFNLEACHVEKKTLKCIADQNTGVQEQAEVFEIIGQPSGFDSVLRSSFGSGASANTTLVSKHAGQGSGGSLLTNSSFSEFDSTATPKFTGWTQTSGASNIAQDTGVYYRSHPGAQTNASLKLSGNALIKQTLTNMRIRRLDVDTPYQFRVMVNKAAGSGSGGNIVIRMGSTSKTVALTALSSTWNEVILDFDQNLWPRDFNQDPFDVEIEWESASSGYLLIDDAIFAPLDQVDGTYWFLRGNNTTHTPWLVDDLLSFTDTGGAPATAKIQYWLWVSGFGYLPSTTGTPTFTEPS
jgi:hypothetical protein